MKIIIFLLVTFSITSCNDKATSGNPSFQAIENSLSSKNVQDSIQFYRLEVIKDSCLKLLYIRYAQDTIKFAAANVYQTVGQLNYKLDYFRRDTQGLFHLGFGLYIGDSILIKDKEYSEPQDNIFLTSNNALLRTYRSVAYLDSHQIKKIFRRAYSTPRLVAYIKKNNDSLSSEMKRVMNIPYLF
jgi:hypothetical protein